MEKGVKREPGAPIDPAVRDVGVRLSRRVFLRALLPGAAGIGAVGALYAYARYVEPRALRVERLTIELPGLPSSLAGLRIAQLSDFHLGPVVREDHVRRAVRTANSLEPDLTVVTGDFVSVARRFARPATEAARELSAPLGVFAVLGNHDFWIAPRMITALLRRAGVAVLRNQAAVVRRDDATVYLAGVDDLWARAHDLDAALGGIPHDGPTILLCHNPDLAPQAAARGVSLMLSGHTHGGQVSLPLYGPVVVPSEHGRLWASGLHRVGRMQLYVNRGVGLISPPVRFLCPPEITLLELRPAPPVPVTV
jgi:predicted MPP superfamily phosphohydrolase